MNGRMRVFVAPANSEVSEIRTKVSRSEGQRFALGRVHFSASTPLRIAGLDPAVSGGIGTTTTCLDGRAHEATEDSQTRRYGTVDEPYTTIPLMQWSRSATWLIILSLAIMPDCDRDAGLTTARSEKAAIRRGFLRLLFSSGGKFRFAGTTLVLRAIALGELVCEIGFSGCSQGNFYHDLSLGFVLGTIGFFEFPFGLPASLDYGQYHWLVALTLDRRLCGSGAVGTISGRILPFLLRAIWSRPGNVVCPFRRHPGRLDGFYYLFPRPPCSFFAARCGTRLLLIVAVTRAFLSSARATTTG